MDAPQLQRTAGINRTDTSTGRTKAGKTCGLTLLELTVVLAIAVVLSLGVIWSAQMADRRMLQNATRAVQADLRFAQRMAMIEGRVWGLEFAGGTYRVYTPDDAAAEGRKTVQPENGVKIMTMAQPTVLYYPRGTPSASFTVTMYKGRWRQQLTILPSSGRIDIKDIVPF